MRLAVGGALMMLVVRPRWRDLDAGQWRLVAALAALLAAFNLLAYASMSVLPLGIVAAVGFLGPIGVGLIGARRGLDHLWPVLALAGIALFAPWGSGAAVSPMTFAVALVYAACWGAYILVSARATRALPGLDALALATAIAAVLVAPVGLLGAAPLLADPRLAVLSLAAGLLAVLAFSLEFVALKTLPARTFGVLLSLEPAVVGVLALVILGEALALLAWLGVALVVAASIGSVMSATRSR